MVNKVLILVMIRTNGLILPVTRKYTVSGINIKLTIKNRMSKLNIKQKKHKNIKQLHWHMLEFLMSLTLNFINKINGS